MRLAPGITEGVVARPIRGREGSTAASLALADTWSPSPRSRSSPCSSAQPRGAGVADRVRAAIVLVNKIAGLYDRDELVLNKTTLDEAPSLLQITGLFTLLVWMGHDAFARWGLDPSSVLVLWVEPARPDPRRPHRGAALRERVSAGPSAAS